MTKHATVDTDRTITVPEKLLILGVAGDHNVNEIAFDCPRYWNGRDLNDMNVYVNYTRSDGVMGQYWCQDVTVDDSDTETVHFTWVLYEDSLRESGQLKFLIHAVKVNDDGEVVNDWNSQIFTNATILPGMEVVGSNANISQSLVDALIDKVERDIAEMQAGAVDKSVIEAAVKAYLEENPVQSVSTDDTLSKSGAAADAKVTGDKITQLSEEKAD